MSSVVRKAAVTLKGNPVDLKGPVLRVGDPAPVVELVDNGLAAVKVGGPSDHVRIFSAVPSLDTPVCDMQTRRFNQDAGAFPGVKVETISVDLPVAQKRWCGAAGVSAVRTLSDHRATAFGDAYGLPIVSGPLTRFLARAVFVVDKAGTVRHVEYVPEITKEPDYAAALAAAKAAAGAK
jgi:thiol peroxidase